MDEVEADRIGPKYAHDSCHDVEHEICQIALTVWPIHVSLAEFGSSAGHKAVIIPL